MSRSTSDRWPKKMPHLTDEQYRIRADFQKVWLETLPQKYGLIEKFNHQYPLRTAVAKSPMRTLDIGAGRGEHASYENLEQQEYVALELQDNLAAVIRATYPTVKVVVGDIQERTGFSDGYFDRILAIHVLEHLPDLPHALDEIKRLLSPAGFFSVLIPCDPGLAYGIARNISARRIFEQRYNQSYDWFVQAEHINHPVEIITELRARFDIVDQTYFPFLIPLINPNLVIGLTLRRPGK